MAIYTQPASTERAPPTAATKLRGWRTLGRWGRCTGAAVVAFATVAAVTVLGEGSAAAQRMGLRSGPPSTATYGKHCLGDQEQKLTLEHYVVGAINPLGLENQFRLSLCTPLIEKPGLLFDFTNVEFGIANYVSPTHVHGGMFGAITPLSILTLKAEVTGFYIWPLGNVFPGAGVFPLQDQNNCVGQYTDLYPVDGQHTTTPTNGFGVRALLGAALQGSVPLGRRLDLLAYNGLNAEYWRYNTDQCIFVARRDVGIHGSGDWVIANTAVLALAIKLTKNQTIRVGATDDLVYTPFNGYLGNVAAGLVSYGINNLRNLARAFSIFVRLGTFTHGMRLGQGLTLAGGLDVTYELAKRPTRRVVQMNEEAAAAAAAAAAQPEPAVAPPPGPAGPAARDPEVAPTGSPDDPTTTTPPVAKPGPAAPPGPPPPVTGAAPPPAGEVR